MIVELREYLLHHGSVPEYFRLVEEEGLAIQRPILGNLVGYYHTDVGVQNQIVHLWAYADHGDRERRRAQLQADPRWQAYVRKIRPLILSQQTRIMRPAPFMNVEVTP